MMKRAMLTMSLAAFTGLANVNGQEAETPKGKETTASVPAEEQKRQLSPFNKASTLIGSAVQAANGKAMGKVQDLVFDLDKGELAYVVIALEAGNGKARQVAVPTRALKPADGANHVVLNMSESVLAATEGLQDGDWPATNVFAVGAAAQAESGTASSSAEEE
jgi:sporulation protein YlmC with PRC-barrel domain